MYNSGSQSPTGVANLRISSPVVRKAYNEQTLIPVTISMILNADSSPTGNGSTTLNDGTDRDLYQVKLVGAIRGIDEQHTNTTYQIEDGTGLIEVKHWTDANQPNPAHDSEDIPKENDYVRIIGQIKNYEDNKHVLAYSLRKLSTGNEVTHHMLEVVYSAEREKKKMEKSKMSDSGLYSTNLPMENLLPKMNQQISADLNQANTDLQGAIINYIEQFNGKILFNFVIIIKVCY